MAGPALTVVIGFRDWGIDRLNACLRAHKERGGDRIDIVVADLGSANAVDVIATCDRLGVTCVTSPDSPEWSRSEALNLAVASSSTPYVVTTDADIIFSRTLYDEIVGTLERSPLSVVLAQCSDLPDGLTFEEASALPDAILAGRASYRPRWGMGGCCAFRRTHWDLIGGFDNRLKIWGGEDNDFVGRMRRIGLTPRWISDSVQRIYHVYHPPFTQVFREDEHFQKVRKFNQSVAHEDLTIFRNLPFASDFSRPEHQPTSSAVSVVISTFKRPDYLRECLDSIAMQTVLPHEVIVVDDSPEREAQQVVEACDGLNVVYMAATKAGISKSRNIATAVCDTPFVVVMDDDDLMPPNRVADHLRSLETDTEISYGGWIDFHQAQGTVAFNPGRSAVSAPMMFSLGKAMTHGAAMYSREALVDFPYFTGFRTGTDFDLNSRMAIAGVRARHTGTFVLLRRLHDASVTSSDGAFQGRASKIKGALFRRTVRKSSSELKLMVASQESALAPITDRPPLKKLVEHLKIAGEMEVCVEVPRGLGGIADIIEKGVQAGASFSLFDTNGTNGGSIQLLLRQRNQPSKLLDLYDDFQSAPIAGAVVQLKALGSHRPPVAKSAFNPNVTEGGFRAVIIVDNVMDLPKIRKGLSARPTWAWTLVAPDRYSNLASYRSTALLMSGTFKAKEDPQQQADEEDRIVRTIEELAGRVPTFIRAEA